MERNSSKFKVGQKVTVAAHNGHTDTSQVMTVEKIYELLGAKPHCAIKVSGLRYVLHERLVKPVNKNQFHCKPNIRVIRSAGIAFKN